MKPINKISSKAVLLPIDNIDTDRIIPARYLTTVSREGLGSALFADWRNDGNGNLIPDFPLNKPENKDAAILITGVNFGCGSSREHAAWAITDAGIQAVISSRFADIFHNNALKNGLLPITLTESQIAEIKQKISDNPELPITINLSEQTAECGNLSFEFSIDPYRKHCLLNGLDDLGFLLSKEAEITNFETSRSVK